MKNKFKKLALVLTTLASIFSTSIIYGQTISMELIYDGKVHNYVEEEVKIEVNGEEIVDTDMPAVIINDRTMVPVRAVFEKLGAEIMWNEATKEVYMTIGSDLVVLQVDSNVGHTNGLAFTMDTTAKIVNDRTMVPVRAASEALGCTVGWDDATRTVTINDKTYVDPSEEEEDTSSSTTTTPSTTGLVSVLNVQVPSSTSSSQDFVINAGGAIGKYDVFMAEGNRLVVDIYDGENKISNPNITTTNSAVVSSIRSAQNQTEPEQISRVVFDLVVSTEYNVFLSSDRKSITVSFDSNEIKEIVTAQQNGMDFVTIYGTDTPIVNIYRLSDPDRVIIDIPNSTSLLESDYRTRDFEHIEELTTSEPESGTTRITLEVNKQVSYRTIEGDGNVTIVIEELDLKDVIYDSYSLTFPNVDDFDERDFVITDDYLNDMYTITLPGDYEEEYGDGILNIENEYVNYIEIKNNSKGKTEFIVYTNSIVATIIDVDDELIRIDFVNPKEVYDKILVLDAGHGGTDPGTSGNGLVEKELNLDLLLKIVDLFDNSNSGVKVYVTRDDDSYPTNISRAEMANEVADIFVSIHHNAVVSPTPQGTETLYINSPAASGTNLTNKILAQFLQDYVVGAIGTVDRGLKEDANLIILNQSNVPAAIVEVGFVTNVEDAATISNETNKNKIANAIYSAVVDAFNQYDYR